MTYKASTNITVPVVLTNATTGLPHIGVLAAAVAVTVIKSSGATVTYVPSGAQWTEYSADAYAGSGYYNLVIPSTVTDVPGILQYVVAVVGDDLPFGAVDIVANLESDTFALISRLLALSYDNINEDQQVYNAENRLTSARFRAYDSAVNALAGGVGGLLYTYAIAAAYDVSGNCTSFTFTRN